MYIDATREFNANFNMFRNSNLEPNALNLRFNEKFVLILYDAKPQGPIDIRLQVKFCLNVD